MTRPRKELVSVADTLYYHCVSRCVRRAFLCGSGPDYDFEHRRDWIVRRLKQLASVFAVDVAAYAVMSNHYHLVLRVDQQLVDDMEDNEVIERWCQLFKGPLLIQKHRAGKALTKPELEVVEDFANTWRERLGDISWFMRCLNEPIARWANEEDGCTGRFFEGRFKNQALLDERALLSCMAYVDLNPIRASMADTPESSDFTSIQERLGIEPEQAQEAEDHSGKANSIAIADLMPFAGNEHSKAQPQNLPFNLADYLELVDWTGRAVRTDKRGAIDQSLPPIIERLGLSSQDWLQSCCYIERRSGRAIGPVAKITELCESLGLKWIHGINQCRRLYAPSS